MPGRDHIHKLPVAGTLFRSSVGVIGLAEWDLACLLMVQAMPWLCPLLAVRSLVEPLAEGQTNSK
jgi:hypothetical protein